MELFDVELSGAPAVSPDFHGGDTINGDAAADLVFGQGAGDLIHGNDGLDYVEGNNGDDSIFGDAGNDDLVGGGSANDGRIDADRVGTGLLDVGETLISGGTEIDWITGDNALDLPQPAARRSGPDPAVRRANDRVLGSVGRQRG